MNKAQYWQLWRITKMRYKWWFQQGYKHFLFFIWKDNFSTYNRKGQGTVYLCYLGRSPPHYRKQTVGSWRIMFLFGVCRVGCRVTMLPPGSALSPRKLPATVFPRSSPTCQVTLVRAGRHTRLGEARKLCFPGREKSRLLFQLLCYLFITSRSIPTDGHCGTDCWLCGWLLCHLTLKKIL